MRPRRRTIDDERAEPTTVPAAPASREQALTGPEQIIALQQSAGNQAVTRMLDTGQSDGPQERGASGTHPVLTGALMKESGKELDQVGPGMFLGDADANEQTPGVTAPDADAALAPEPGAATATADAGPAPATAAGPGAAPATDAGPGTAPGTGGPAAAPGTAPAPAALTINSRTDMRAPDGTPNTRTTVAMGEVVYFDVGGQAADWSASAGWPPSRRTRSRFAWELDKPGAATITATLPTGETASIDMTVIGPTDIRMRKESEDAQPAGTAGAGMWLIPRFNPGSVNFGNVEWLEEAGPASGVTGYFADMVTAGTDLSHHPNPDFLRIGPGLRDHAAFLGLPAPFTAGEFSWSIPNRFRRAATAGTGTMFVTTVQRFRIQADGTVTVSKQGASVTRSP